MQASKVNSLMKKTILYVQKISVLMEKLIIM